MPLSSHIAPLVHRASLLAATVVALAATIGLGLAARGWVDTTFPGFFVLDNRVVASVGLPFWSGSQDGTLYQQAVVAVDGKPIAVAADTYRRVAHHAPGTLVTYSLQSGATRSEIALATMRFTAADYWLLFGSYLVTGTLYLALGILVAWLRPEAALARALLLVGGTGGLYALSAVGIYGGDAALRMHALVEAFFPATLVYLALVLPRSRRHLVQPIAALGWCLSLALAIPYQLLLGQPGAYSILHGACETYLGLAGVALVARLVLEHARTGRAAPVLLRCATAGALAGIGVPAIVMILSGLSGGGLPVNVMTSTAFVFPLCLGWGVLRDRRERRRALRTAIVGAPA